jgi:predicted phosphate transport protein (TIGR00153 family)
MSLISGRKKENTFIRLLRQQAEKLQEGVNGLWLYVTEGSEEGAVTLERCEKEGDELRRVLIDELHDTFITPFDREDIYQLSLYLDDVLDYAYTTILEMKELEVGPDKYLIKMVERVREAADELLLAMERLDGNPKVALDHSRRTKHRENQVERIYREAIADLFSGPEDIHHVMEMLRVREVYRHISNAADQADQAANVLGIVVMKMT